MDPDGFRRLCGRVCVCKLSGRDNVVRADDVRRSEIRRFDTRPPTGYAICVYPVDCCLRVSVAHSHSQTQPQTEPGPKAFKGPCPILVKAIKIAAPSAGKADLLHNWMGAVAARKGSSGSYTAKNTVVYFKFIFNICKYLKNYLRPALLYLM